MSATDKAYRQEMTQQELESEAQALRVNSGFKISIETARDRVAGAEGWVHWAHMLRCKQMRGVK